ncbi:IS110 family transposase [Dyadobacter sp. LHD-138]|uniref:IS110 family transposase n=1 Tax=Dyadobacter sp. LHD-138 TaxID=3071413 RepID=UPI0027DEE705|nr:IS110 family transposase [Dyadobacter sp. LHD-138]MDQ6482665.1 IS110 family transposase [Dyadobacter sp. LHD-138]
MKRIVKQVLGVDVAQKELVVCLGRMHDDLSADLYAHKTFPNTAKGFVLLVEWVKKLTHSNISVRYVMEPTGVYHEALAYFLSDQGMEVSIVLPNKISNYARSLTIKTVTDRTASEAITRFGLERHLDLWKKPLPIYKSIKQLTRERDQIISERTVVKNQQHAELSEAHPAESTLQRIHKRLMLLNNQEKEISQEISMLIKTDQKVESQMQLLCSLPGVGTLTAATILAETNGFDLIRNKRQLASYAGLDVKEKQSGTSVKGKPQISKRGNRFIRKAMHMPALAAIRHDEHFKTIFVRLVSKHGIKMKAAVAIQRKLLELMFTLFKTNEKYDSNHFKKLEAVPMDHP